MKVTGETIIGDLLDYDINVAQFFFEAGMFCLGCPSSRGESITEACEVHMIDSDEIIKKINEYFTEKEKEEAKK